jgi:hypothetical protein
LFAVRADAIPILYQVIPGSPFQGSGGGGGGGGGTWGSITGTLSAQTDLQTALDAKLNEPATSGIIARTGLGTTAARTMTAGTGIIVTNGDGVSGNPTYDVDTSIIPIYASGTASVPATGTVGSFYFETDRNAAYTYTSTNTETWLLSLAAGAGTSGGIPYFTGTADTLASSAALTANLPVIGGGAGAAPTVGTRSGNTTAYVTTTGAQTSGDCVKIDASGNHIANGSACGGGGGGWTLSAKTFADTPVTVGTTNIAYSCDATSGATVFNLPACSTNANLIVILKKIDSSANKCELARNGADTIDGQTVWDIITQYGSVTIQCNGGTAWYLE